VRRAGTPTQPSGWRGSLAQIAVGRAAIRSWNAKRHLAPKCGAKAKSHGGPCQQVAMANGRCYFHSGKVGKGENWRKPVWPDGKAPGSAAKLNRKLDDLQRAAAKRAKRVAAMSPDERAAYEHWKRTHKPGSAAARARARRERQEALAVREVIARAASLRPAPTAETVELDSLIADRKAALDKLLSGRAADIEHPEPDTETSDLGAFG
jgi:hypothetical protein